MKRWIGVGLALLLGAAVAAAVITGNGDGEAGDLAPVHGVIGSEKKPFFDDPKVKAAFARHGLRVEVDTAGSRQIVSSVDLSAYDFAFPSSAPAAERIRQAHKVTEVFSPFYSPMAIATYEPIAGVLEKAGVVRDSGQGYQILDVRKYMDLVDKKIRWDALPGNTAYPARKRVLMTTTDIRTSNSAAMYLAIAGYVANGEEIVASRDDAAKVAERVAPLFLDQGYSADSTEAPFEDYLVMGAGKTPMVMIYETQYAARVFARDGSITPEMRLLYPSPTVLSKHTLVPLRARGADVGRLLQKDAELGALAARHGFRTSDTKGFADLAAATRAPLARALVDVVEPPAYDHLEGLIAAIERRYLNGSAPAS